MQVALAKVGGGAAAVAVVDANEGAEVAKGGRQHVAVVRANRELVFHLGARAAQRDFAPEYVAVVSVFIVFNTN